MISGIIITLIYYYGAILILLCHTQTFIWFGCCLRQKMNQPHGHAELQTQFQLSSEAQHLHYLMDELERDEKGKNDRKIQPESWLGWKNSRAAAWHGLIRREAASWEAGTARLFQGAFYFASQMWSCLIPGGKAWLAQLCCLHVSYWRGRARHSWKESKHSFWVYQGHDQSFQQRSFKCKKDCLGPNHRD